MKIYKKSAARKMFDILLNDEEKRRTERCMGYFREENGLWIAFDNRSGEFFTEEFRSKKKAKCWLEVS